MTREAGKRIPTALIPTKKPEQGQQHCLISSHERPFPCGSKHSLGHLASVSETGTWAARMSALCSPHAYPTFCLRGDPGTWLGMWASELQELTDLWSH